jgi:hypothetical protein
LDGEALLPPAVGLVLLHESARAAAASTAEIFKKRMARSFLERWWVIGSNILPPKSDLRDGTYV